jgi:hypothetical protein
MSAATQHTALIAEQRQVQAQLGEVPPTAALTRKSLESRSLVLGELIRSLEAGSLHEPAHARLTFSGKPVFGTQGVLADFAAQAVSKFADAVAAAAAAVSGAVAAMGPIPGRERNQLMITGTAIGSFGFELQETSRDELAFDDVTPVALALDLTQKVMKAAAEADDERLADAAAELAPRAIGKVREFVELLVNNEAICALDVGGKVFKFSDINQAKASLDRLSSDNLIESQVVLMGEFQGVIPARRTFQFRTNDEEIVGKIGAAIEDPKSLNKLLDQPLLVTMLRMQVGSGRPRYTLLSDPNKQEPI